MHLDNHVTSLQLSKRLAELGVKQESLFYWADRGLVISIDIDLLLENGNVRSLSGVNNYWPDQNISELYSAFTVAELGEMLPFLVNDNYRIWMEKFKKAWSYDYFYGEDSVAGEDIMFCDTNEANARAKMLIYLIENKLIEV